MVAQSTATGDAHTPQHFTKSIRKVATGDYMKKVMVSKNKKENYRQQVIHKVRVIGRFYKEKILKY